MTYAANSAQLATTGMGGPATNAEDTAVEEREENKDNGSSATQDDVWNQLKQETDTRDIK